MCDSITPYFAQTATGSLQMAYLGGNSGGGNIGGHHHHHHHHNHHHHQHHPDSLNSHPHPNLLHHHPQHHHPPPPHLHHLHSSLVHPCMAPSGTPSPVSPTSPTNSHPHVHHHSTVAANHLMMMEQQMNSHHHHIPSHGQPTHHPHNHPNQVSSPSLQTQPPHHIAHSGLNESSSGPNGNLMTNIYHESNTHSNMMSSSSSSSSTSSLSASSSIRNGTSNSSSAIINSNNANNTSTNSSTVSGGNHLIYSTNNQNASPPLPPRAHQNPSALHYGNHLTSINLNNHNHIQHQQPPYPRFPPYDKIVEQQQQQLRKFSASPHETSQNDNNTFYSSNNSGNSNGAPPTAIATQIGNNQIGIVGGTPTPYGDCGERSSITPTSLDGSNGTYNCKMINEGVMTPIGHGSPSPPSMHHLHQQQQQLYSHDGHLDSPGPPQSQSAISSPLYPWMRSQFGTSKMDIHVRLSIEIERL
ncbi:hypothetical protein SSS_02454 [Sarcoptes scabiei]|uniref:Uncharacterized protein n=1 Tax=Sarcoptes scabiei TaxID=52283 RepID=A0A834RGH2_SARSC|nr:hypothetical protein SSS_02454 [Sarcoptes scabiei]